MDNVVFDLKKVTGRQLAAFFKAGAANDIEGLATFFAGGVIVSCPAEWGDPGSVDTYLDLPFYTELTPLIRAFAEAAKKNATS